MIEIFSRIAADEMLHLTANQCLEKGSLHEGGIVLPENGYAEPTDSGHAIEGLYGLFVAGDSPFSDDDLQRRITLLLDHLLRRQHDDGTQDLMGTNFHDTSSTAFAIQYLYYTFLLADERDDDLSVQVCDRLNLYFTKGASALAYGGFHTPNHRWVIASAIMQLLHLTEMNKISVDDTVQAAMSETLNKYLNEGIDMDEWGEYTEKSVGIYNIHCNNSLLIMEECNNHLKTKYFDPGYLLQYVKRNLDLMPAYMEPDGSLFSAKSTRQGSGYKIYPDPYFINYLIYGYMTCDQSYRERGAYLLSLNGKRSRRSMESLCRILYDRKILSWFSETETALLPKESYFNSQFGLYRKNRENTSLTIAAATPFFFRFSKGSNTVALRLSASWYGEKGQFIPTKMEQHDDSTFILSWENTWGYIRPYDEPPQSSDWDRMDHYSRDNVHVHTLAVKATISLLSDSTLIDITMDTDCTVPYKLEAIYSPDGYFRTTSESGPVICRGWADTELIAGGAYRYNRENSIITVDGGFAEHNRGAGMRGSEPPVPGSFTVTSTGMTPDKRQIRIY